MPVNGVYCPQQNSHLYLNSLLVKSCFTLTVKQYDVLTKHAYGSICNNLEIAFKKFLSEGNV